MRHHRTLLSLSLAAGLAASCASAAMTATGSEPAAPDDGISLTPVVVDNAGRMTRRPVAVDAAPGRITPDRSAFPAVLEEAEGEATYYADKFDGRRAASGVVFRNSEAYAAHRTYPFGTIVRVTSLVNDRSVILRVIDRGPHGTSARARRTIIDVSQSAARELDFIRAGRIPVRVEVLEWGTGTK